MTASLDTAKLRVTTGEGRHVLEARIAALADVVEELRAMNLALSRNLDHTQRRCTQLLFENRHLRLTGSEETDFLVAVLDRLQIARAKYPGNAMRLAGVIEEAGECARALHKSEGPRRLFDECVDLATCALRLALEGDAAFEGEQAVTARRSVDWLIINANRGGSFDCLRCGQSYLPTYPAPVEIMLAIWKALEKTHRSCKPNAEGDRCDFCLQLGHAYEACPTADVKTVDAWLRGPDTGLSSRTIVDALTGRGAEYDAYSRSMRYATPADPGDFGRCYRLLARFPELRPRLGEVAERHPEWAPFVREWDRMTALYKREKPTGKAPELFALMQELSKEGRAT